MTSGSAIIFSFLALYWTAGAWMTAQAANLPSGGYGGGYGMKCSNNLPPLAGSNNQPKPCQNDASCGVDTHYCQPNRLQGQPGICCQYCPCGSPPLAGEENKPIECETDECCSDTNYYCNKLNITGKTNVCCPRGPDGTTQAPQPQPTTTAGYVPTTTAGYVPTTTAGYVPTTTAGYVPTTTAGYVPTTTAGYVPTTTAGYVPTTTAGYVPTTTAGYVPTTTAGYVPSTTVGYVATTTAGYVPTTTVGYVPTTTAGYIQTTTAGYVPTTTVGYVPSTPAGYVPTTTPGYVPGAADVGPLQDAASPAAGSSPTWQSMFSEHKKQNPSFAIPNANSFWSNNGAAVPTSGQFKPCTKNADCYTHREPNEWCKSQPEYNWVGEGCACAKDAQKPSCIITREKVSNKQKQWTFCKSEATFKCT